jgi:hypothetical protein
VRRRRSWGSVRGDTELGLPALANGPCLLSAPAAAGYCSCRPTATSPSLTGAAGSTLPRMARQQRQHAACCPPPPRRVDISLPVCDGNGATVEGRGLGGLADGAASCLRGMASPLHRSSLGPLHAPTPRASWPRAHFLAPIRLPYLVSADVRRRCACFRACHRFCKPYQLVLRCTKIETHTGSVDTYSRPSSWSRLIMI